MNIHKLMRRDLECPHACVKDKSNVRLIVIKWLVPLSSLQNHVIKH